MKKWCPGTEFDAHLSQVQVKKTPASPTFYKIVAHIKAQSSSTTLSIVVQGLLWAFLCQFWTLLKAWGLGRGHWSVDRGPWLMD